MHLPKELLSAAQEEDRACSRLVSAVEQVAEFSPSLQSHKVCMLSYTLLWTAIHFCIHAKVAPTVLDRVEITVLYCAGFKVFTAVVMKSCVFRDIIVLRTGMYVVIQVSNLLIHIFSSIYGGWIASVA
jgi:hypothetical protein